MFDFRDKDGVSSFEAGSRTGLRFRFLENGSLLSITREDILINQVLGSPVEGGPGGLFLRRRGPGGIRHFAVRGPASGADFYQTEDGALWQGRSGPLHYSCRLRLARRENLWFWTVRVQNRGGRTEEMDAILTQDLGLASEGMIRSNEAYTSQYIDHTVIEHPELGYLLCSRQNQRQDPGFPWIMQGCLDRAVGYLTDGFQFYGLRYKETGVPEALTAERLPGQRLQYEFALSTLQSAAVAVAPGETAEWTFFALYKENHRAPTGPGDLALAERARAAYEQLKSADDSSLRQVNGSPSLFDTAPLLQARNLRAAEIDARFGRERRHEERGLSFFYGPDVYVALKKKELLLERPHGHILRTGRDLLPDDETLSSTSWIYGVFHSQVTIGNTSFNKLLSLSRNPLGVLRSAGQRVFVKTERGYALLGVPSAFEISPSHLRWIYQTGPGKAIVVRAWASLEDPACFLQIEVEGGQEREFLITHSLVLGERELDQAGRVDIEGDRVAFLPAEGGFIEQHYPETRFFLVSPDREAIEAIGGDELLYGDGQRRNGPFVVVKTRPVRRFSLALTGNVLSAARAVALAEKYAGEIEPFEETKEAAGRFWSNLQKGAAMRLGNRDDGVSRINDLLPWYAHNALIHFTVPHGLEQYSGAAWGLRDVCQGPAEFLTATRSFGAFREMLRIVFAHQSPGTGDWPQWFMFDRYRKIRAGDSHGDIILWPLKALCEYVENTNDFSLLDEEIPYTDDESLLPTGEKATIWEHVEKEIAGIEAGCVPGTALYHYGHGDWEDTLQPADPEMRERMVSSWTVELAYQTLGRFARLCRRAGRPALAERLDAFCERIRADFNKHLVKDGVVAGLVYFRGRRAEYLLHPRDRKTEVKYRLLPMTRGMISGIFTPEQAKAHLAIIRESLLFPDGVRLMDRPLPYRGGVERLFKRAESAANFGREIGLQYVHAHIRYIEAMAALGEAEAVYEGLLSVAPITLHKIVPNARPRQSNAYFSSSDAAFADRYEAYRRFSEIGTGDVPVKGGWRIYSSGPGIYVGQVIGSLLGLRRLFEDLVFDPVLPRRLDGLEFDFEQGGRRVRYTYHVARRVFSPERIVVNGREVGEARYGENPYRRGGFLVRKTTFDAMLDRDENSVEIYL